MVFLKTITFIAVLNVLRVSTLTLERSTPEVEGSRPVSPVISLLKKLLAELEAESARDEKIYKELRCWCQTNDREATKAIADGKDLDVQLTSSVEENTANTARLSTQVKNLESDIASHQASLDQATALRKKQLADFTQNEKELLEAIGALKAAITVMQKHHSFLQKPRVVSNLLQVIKGHDHLLRKTLTQEQRTRVLSLFQTNDRETYNPQSGEIFGILEQMLESFQANLKATQEEEQRDQHEFDALKANLEQSISMDSDAANTKKNEDAATKEANAKAKQELADTESQTEADEKFLAAVRSKCAVTDREWEERQRTRGLEVDAITKALEILSSDNAHDNFRRTFSVSLLQVSSPSGDRSRAARLLLSAADRTHSSQLALVANRVVLDSFTKVKEAIDKMVTDLKKQKADDIKHKDWCVQERQAHDIQAQEISQDQEDLNAQISATKTRIEDTKKIVGELSEEISILLKNKNQAGVEREEENQQFRTELADHDEARRVLTEAFTTLTVDFSLTQTGEHQPVDPLDRAPPPAGFERYEKKLEEPKQMLQNILTRLDAMTTDITRAEEEAQMVYEKFLRATNQDLIAKNARLIDEKSILAQAEKDLSEHEENLATQNLMQKQLEKLSDNLHTSCDFVLRNFDLRQAAFADEIQALNQAKSVLSGDQSSVS
jgi:hypothetical protein